MNVAEAVGATLARLGVGHAFGVVGSGNFALVRALRSHGVPYTAARHEGGAATMADAYSRTAGRLAIVTTHQGCGFTNALTGVAEAAKSRTSLLVLTADAPLSARFNNFRVDQDAAARALGAVAERVHSPGTAVADAERAWTIAMHDRRTVVLSVPIDLLAQPTSEVAVGAPGSGDHTVDPRAVRPTAEDAQALADLLVEAQRPVFIAGRGAREAGAEIAALAERCGALLATSAVVKGLFRGSADGVAPPHGGADLGISGGFATPLAAELIAAADVIVGFGCALNNWTTRHGRLIAPGARIAHVDLDPLALGAHRPIALGVVGDCALVARDTAALLVPGGLADSPEKRERGSEREGARQQWGWGYRSPEVLARIAAEGRWRDVPFERLDEPGRIDPRTVTIALDDALPAERMVAVDSGNFMGYPSQFLDVPDVAGFCFTQAFQSIGLGLATAIGAAIARPDRIPVLGTGDGGFHMAIADLETAVRLRQPLVVLVYNDTGYSAEVHHFGESDETVAFPDTDLAAIARGFGADGVTVRGPEDLPAMAAAVAACVARPHDERRPLVIDAKIASDGGSWWLAEAFRAH
ncbi:MAG TPA: thiamine pyrophosphate-binding protein [Arachnia sp.]|nr:thiamine pyrophosphate-binding protein [Arachnia sp.]HMT86368.1 thiamine pyrophosphate-binding protein [Arachnia sp.]